MDIMEILLNWVIPGVIAILAGIGAFKIVKKETSKIKSLDELSDYLLTDKTVVDIINKLISACKEDAARYDTAEEFIQKVKEDIHAEFISFIVKTYNLPKAIVDQLTIENLSYILDSIFDKYNLKEMLENIFNEQVLEEIESNEDLEELHKPINLENKEDISDKINEFYE